MPRDTRRLDPGDTVSSYRKDLRDVYGDRSIEPDNDIESTNKSIDRWDFSSSWEGDFVRIEARVIRTSRDVDPPGEKAIWGSSAA
jgi:hypothetical protein